MVTLSLQDAVPEISRPAGIPSGRLRLESIDILRGLVMIFMALDHTRDFFGVAAFSPTDPTRTTVQLFFTRWITHFCPPVFFLLTGTGAFLTLRRKSKRELSQFLFTRGVWLLFLELTFFRCFGLQFNFDYHFTLLNVLWALGWTMIILSVLVHLSTATTFMIGVVMIAGHNLLDPIRSSSPVWVILHSPDFVLRSSQHTVFAAYSLIPWIGVGAVGYGLGHIFSWTSERRRKVLLRAGLGTCAAFLVLRTINIYGDPIPWTVQRSAVFTVLSFLNTTKYPPSLQFLLMTLGPVLVFLWAIDRVWPRFLRPCLVFGRVPLFYFLLHMPLIHLIAVAICYVRYGHVHWMFESPSIAQFPITAPPGWGFALAFVYTIWVSVVLALYPVCRWFGAVKQSHLDSFLSYL